MKQTSSMENPLTQLGHDIRRLYQSLDQGSSEQAMLAQIEQAIQDMAAGHVRNHQVYSGLLMLMLNALMNYLSSGVGTDLHQELQDLIDRLQSPMTDQDIALLYTTLINVTDQLSKGGLLSLDQASMIINPLVMEFTAADSKRQQSDADPTTSPQRVKSRRYLRDTNRIGYDVLDAISVQDQHMPGSGEIKALQQEFIEQLRRTVSQISQFSDQMEREIAYIHSIASVTDVDSFKQSVLNTLQSLQHGHEAIALNFDGAKSYLRIIESGSQQLMDELDRVRLLSLTDDLTGLPNRRAFLRRIDTEVQRILRYKHPLSLVLIDLDYFKRINDRYGHSVGDCVLKTYADQVFPLFRQHDLVARYGGEEFVILFPDTDIEGVLLAMRKLQGICGDISVEVAEGMISLPGFSAGVAEYCQQESAENFIERADKALYLAKQKGRGRIEIAQQTENMELV